MKIELKNFGPIDHFEFDMDKDLHVIYGENNLGKSYAMSAVYLILKWLNNGFLNWLEPYRLYIQGSLPEIDTLTTYVKAKRKTMNEVILNEQFQTITQSLLNNYFIENLNNSLKNTFPKVKSIFTNNNINQPLISIKSNIISIDIMLTEDNFLVVENINISREILLKFSERQEDSYYHSIDWFTGKYKAAFVINKKYIQNKIVATNFCYFLSYLISNLGIRKQLNFLPASRSGLYHGLTSFPALIAQISQYRFLINDTFSIPSLTEPMSDYYLALNSVHGKSNKGNFSNIANQIEEQIIKGKIEYNLKDKRYEMIDNRFGVSFELSETSSMIAEIAPIVAFLKYIINENENNEIRFQQKRSSRRNSFSPPILFIEEPEAHLHPKIQVEMMKVFVELVKAGVKVVMTTHSDYMKDTLSNLLLSGDIKPEKVASYRFVMGENGSYDAGDMKATDEGIEDHNFTSVAVELYEERVRLLEKRYEANDAQ